MNLSGRPPRTTADGQGAPLPAASRSHDPSPTGERPAAGSRSGGRSRTRDARPIPWGLSFVVLGAIWGCSFWWIKLGLRAASPVDVAFGRLAGGAVALLVIAAVTRTRLPRSAATWGHLFVLAVFLNSAPFTLFAYGETHVSAVSAGIINALTPLAALAAAVVVFGQRRPEPRIVAGLAIGFAGVLVVIGVWHGVGHGRLTGIGACLGAVACYGIAYAYSHQYLTGPTDPPVALATGQVLCGAGQLLPFALVIGRVHHHVPGSSVLAVAALGVLGSGIAYILNFHVVKHAPPAVASSVTYLTPVFAILVGAAFLGESVTWFEPAGGLLILASAALSQDRLRGAGELARVVARQWHATGRRVRGDRSAVRGGRARRAPSSRWPGTGPPTTDRSGRPGLPPGRSARRGPGTRGSPAG